MWLAMFWARQTLDLGGRPYIAHDHGQWLPASLLGETNRISGISQILIHDRSTRHRAL
jgi:hypothetical protein